MIDPLDSAIAQLRHLYHQMVDGYVSNTQEAAKGLLGPAIEQIEVGVEWLREWPPYESAYFAINMQANALEILKDDISVAKAAGLRDALWHLERKLGGKPS